MNEVIFRSYDIRGRVGVDFQIEDAYTLGRALASYFLRKDPTVKRVAVGMDGRDHSPAIKEQVTRALRASGLDVVFIGLCPTPVLYFTLFTEPVDAGIMITASHNGPQYNGMKICLRKHTVALEEIIEIRNIVRTGLLEDVHGKGGYEEKYMNTAYIEYVSEAFKHLKGSELKIAIDCGGGATATIMPSLIERMQWKNATVLFGDIDGQFSRRSPDPTVEAHLQDLKIFVINNQSDIAGAFDGDGDRMVPVTEHAHVIAGDKMLAVFAHQMLHEYPAFAVIFDVKSSTKLAQILSSWGLEPVMAPTGHAFIKRAMHKHHGLLAGEMSCHFFFADRYFGFDDGIYAFLRLVEVLVLSKKSLHELLAMFPRSYATPEIRVACSPGKEQEAIAAIKQVYASQPDVDLCFIDGVRVSFADGWALVRASNTEPVISLRFEAESPQRLHTLQEQFASMLKDYVDEPLALHEIVHV